MTSEDNLKSPYWGENMLSGFKYARVLCGGHLRNRKPKHTHTDQCTHNVDLPLETFILIVFFIDHCYIFFFLLAGPSSSAGKIKASVIIVHHVSIINGMEFDKCRGIGDIK